jgi:hypothetical protein
LTHQPKSSDVLKLFSVTIVLRPNDSDDGVICDRTESITSGIQNYIRKNAVEGVLIQSVQGTCLTLSAAFRFGASRARNDLQKYLRDRLVLNCFEDRPKAVNVMCTVTSACEDERHAIYEALRRMVQRLLATSILVLDTVPAAADPPAPLSAGGVRPGAPAAQFLGGAPQPASAAAPHVAGRAVAAGAPREDPGLRAGAPGPAGPPVASATAASCDSGVLPLCGLDRSRFIRVVIKVDVGGSSIFENTWREAYADPYLASRVVDATSRFFGERQMDHILSTTARLRQTLCAGWWTWCASPLPRAWWKSSRLHGTCVMRLPKSLMGARGSRTPSGTSRWCRAPKRSFRQLEPRWRTGFETIRRFIS